MFRLDTNEGALPTSMAYAGILLQSYRHTNKQHYGNYNVVGHTFYKLYYRAYVQAVFRMEPLTVSSDINIGIKNYYENPNKLGSDRICRR